MHRIPPLDHKKLMKVLIFLGFKKVRQKGSHVIFRKNSQLIVVPVHAGRKIKPSLVRLIIRELNISREKFFEILKKV